MARLVPLAYMVNGRRRSFVDRPELLEKDFAPPRTNPAQVLEHVRRALEDLQRRGA